MQVCNSLTDYSNKVLIVDHDPMICETLAQTLKGAGYEPEVHLHPRGVMSGLSTELFTLAFIEIDLPDMNGFDLAQVVKRSGRLEDFIFMSRGGTFDTVVRAIKLGAYDFLQKPFDTNELGMLLMRLRERNKLQRLLFQAEVKYHSLIQNVPLLIFSLRSDFELRFINQASNSIMGYTPEEALTTAGWFLERVHPLERGRVREALGISFSQGAPSSLECRMIHKNGSEVHGLIRTIPGLRDEDDFDDGRLPQIEGIFVDITDRVFLEKALVQNEKLKTLGAISAEMAHEVRNPLMSIAGFARRLAKKAPDMPEVGIILRESSRLERLLNRIRDYLKPVQARPRECSINAVLGESLGLLYPEMNERAVWCKLERIQEAPLVLADPDYLSQVFINLIRNALIALDQDSYFTICSFESSDKVHIELRMPRQQDVERNSEYLFMPFEEGGQSFGLPLCYRLVKDMGGLLSFSQDVEYDVFTLSLPKFRSDEQETPTFGNGASTRESQFCFDEKTGVLSRRRFEDIFERAFLVSQREGLSLALIAAEIDDFDMFAETNGERQGLECVNDLALRFGRVLKKPDQLLSLFGRNEFMILLPGADMGLVESISEQLRLAAKDLRTVLPTGQERCRITVSVGGTSCVPDHSQKSQDMVAAVSHALSLAGRQGGNVFQLIDISKISGKS